LIPTQEAQLLMPEVEIALQSVEHVTELARNLHNANYGELKIVAPPSFSEGLLSSVVSSFIRRYPQVSISMDSHGVETALKMIALRAVDCGFTKLPIEYPGLISEPLLEAGTVCVVPMGHALCAKQAVSVEDLNQQPLILLGKGRSFRRDIEQAFARQKIPMQIRVETHTVGSACALVRGNIGIAIVNEMLARQYAGDALALLPFTPDIRHQYAFVTSDHAPMTRITRQFLTHCRTVFGLGGLAGGLGTADWGRRDQKMSIRKPMKEKKYTTDQKRGGLGVGGLGTERSKNEHS
jgi:DNA-binding transcriptional LysR family regulator